MPCTRVVEFEVGKLVYSGFTFEMTREMTISDVGGAEKRNQDCFIDFLATRKMVNIF